jgi:hypothetical protein
VCANRKDVGNVGRMLTVILQKYKDSPLRTHVNVLVALTRFDGKDYIASVSKISGSYRYVKDLVDAGLLYFDRDDSLSEIYRWDVEVEVRCTSVCEPPQPLKAPL